MQAWNEHNNAIILGNRTHEMGAGRSWGLGVGGFTPRESQHSRRALNILDNRRPELCCNWQGRGARTSPLGR